MDLSTPLSLKLLNRIPAEVKETLWLNQMELKVYTLVICASPTLNHDKNIFAKSTKKSLVPSIDLSLNDLGFVVSSFTSYQELIASF